MNTIHLSSGVKHFETAVSSASSRPWTINAAEELTWSVDYSALGDLKISHKYCNGAFSGYRGESPKQYSGLSLLLVLNGSYNMLNGHEEVFCPKDSITLIDNAGSSESEQRVCSESISISLPNAHYNKTNQILREFCNHPLATTDGHPRLLKNFLTCLADMANGFSPRTSTELRELLFSHIYASFSSSSLPCAQNSKYVVKIAEIIQQNLSDPELSPHIVAEKLGISTSYLYSLFKHSKTTINQFIIDERLKQIRHRLASNAWHSQSITEIALDAGFSDLSHFSRRFKTKYGLSPRQYRQTFGPNSRAAG